MPNFCLLCLILALSAVQFLHAQDNVSANQVKDSSATVTTENSAIINTDKDSYVYYGPNSAMFMKSDASQTLKIQSGLRLLPKAIFNVGNATSMSYTESSQLSIGGKVEICRNSKFVLDASRALVMGTAQYSYLTKFEMYDSSVFRVHEGGILKSSAECEFYLYRGAQLVVSEWWQPKAALDDLRAKLYLFNQSKVELLDRSSFQIGLGCFEGTGKISIKLEEQATFFSKGTVNVTDGSSINLGQQSNLLIGTTDRRFDSATMPTLAFAKPNLKLNLGPRASLKIELGAHCMFVASADINDNVVLTSTSTDKQYAGCFDSPSALQSAMSAL